MQQLRMHAMGLAANSLGLLRDTGTVLKKHRHHFDMAILGSPMQSSSVVPVAEENSENDTERCSEGPTVPRSSCAFSLLVDFIHNEPMLEQQTRTFHIIF
jgi:hypothetical protein